MSSAEVAAILGVSDKTIRRAAIDGDIPPHCYVKNQGKKGRGRYRFWKAALRYYVEHLGSWPPTERAMAKYSREVLQEENERLKDALRKFESAASAAA